MKQTEVTMTITLKRKVNYKDAADLKRKVDNLSCYAAMKDLVDTNVGGSIWDLDEYDTDADEDDGYDITPDDYTYDDGELGTEDTYETGEVPA